jgi:hypothetical protein
MGVHASTPGIEAGLRARPHLVQPGLLGGDSPRVSTALGQGIDPARTLEELRRSLQWADTNQLAARLLGRQSFGLGAIYGIGARVVSDVVGLAELGKTFILADLYDLSHKRRGWSGTASFGTTLLGGPIGVARALAAAGASAIFEKELLDAANQRDELIQALRYAFTHPREVFGQIKQEYIDKWRDFERLSQEAQLSSQFKAGRIFGELLLEVLALFATGAALLKLAAKIPQLARAATRLAKLAKSLPPDVIARIRQGTTPPARPKASTSSALTPSQLMREREAAAATSGSSGKTVAASRSETPAHKASRPATEEPKAPARSPLEGQLDEMYAKAPAAKAEIDALADNIAQATGGTVAKAPLKGRARALEKAREYEAVGLDATAVKDIARNTIVVEQSQYAKAVAMLKEQGAKVKTIEAASDPMGYSGTNSVIKTRAGITAEIQVNTPEMIYAKESPPIAKAILGEEKYAELAAKTGVPGGRGHALYEEYRVLPEGDPRAAALRAESRAYYDHVRQAAGE